VQVGDLIRMKRRTPTYGRVLSQPTYAVVLSIVGAELFNRIKILRAGSTIPEMGHPSQWEVINESR